MKLINFNVAFLQCNIEIGSGFFNETKKKWKTKTKLLDDLSEFNYKNYSCETQCWGKYSSDTMKTHTQITNGDATLTTTLSLESLKWILQNNGIFRTQTFYIKGSIVSRVDGIRMQINRFVFTADGQSTNI